MILGECGSQCNLFLYSVIYISFKAKRMFTLRIGPIPMRNVNILLALKLIYITEYRNKLLRKKEKFRWERTGLTE